MFITLISIIIYSIVAINLLKTNEGIIQTIKRLLPTTNNSINHLENHNLKKTVINLQIDNLNNELKIHNYHLYFVIPMGSSGIAIFYYFFTGPLFLFYSVVTILCVLSYASIPKNIKNIKKVLTKIENI